MQMYLQTSLIILYYIKIIIFRDHEQYYLHVFITEFLMKVNFSS
jgi:hypothetical protein